MKKIFLIGIFLLSSYSFESRADWQLFWQSNHNYFYWVSNYSDEYFSNLYFSDDVNIGGIGETDALEIEYNPTINPYNVIENPTTWNSMFITSAASGGASIGDDPDYVKAAADGLTQTLIDLGDNTGVDHSNLDALKANLSTRDN
jgi:hypothetical protein